MLPFIIAISLSYVFQGTILSRNEEFVRWLSDFGPLVILVYVLLQSVTIIFAPIGGFFMVIAMITLFGPEIALTLVYLVSTPLYVVNFYIAKRFGRPLVEKLTSKEVLGKVDHFVQDAGTLAVVVMRLFQGGNFDYISYGLGLTKFPLKTFILVNFLVGIPSTLLNYFVLTRFENLVLNVVVFYAVTITLTGVSIYINHRIRKHKKLLFP
ncbi:MAG: hypothetical protein A3D24_03485 [Candidatus Blackburnbacteria bacterium RIFCSPHIGHO2_02_FULL_39_13]|uniref:TVP38/TMEM64 family membrane protein n=1 Tax=Candidatus Blackburnbacteria bacterium RIFCSPLOWO2_01_FULL_40_20 TaxID=1797519 RepID=A0A1G1VDT9_9BACT|nr:MAG: hypothetical protein A2694_02175 [Candidatus Blackburnbacteria bacterium RIFCSPHIGHO2_01_FULL_40_17]OGY08154.1 MAG: hypothetical protein A3D24_03485 [Candidatus Blackburnbacteria bacterium RIFCSPHIGHO2_02_FULL_39_13]OGY13426.1 MAG: hypothetical protein A3A77_04625 [Candidatus Blackburnbacteria bacterium RIFCSPLOWO2_01_FULL_40_20]OGY14679.1 MAG: hypothetical protein A3I52_02135 [Candidatus Blackburnbacteria bacterium RIFCSPLOWO2_02_FULL_40_10]